ncbi:MAG: hypothetical protein AB1578_07105 [Thermodesulfobacteriota bacterium]
MGMGSICRPGRSRTLAWGAVILGLAVAGCRGGERPLVTVSGKTAYGDLAVEEVAVTALRAEGGAWLPAAATRSGYHGSWVLRLPAGTYRLEARGSLPGPGAGALLLAGAREGIVLTGAEGRLDRLVISLVPDP